MRHSCMFTMCYEIPLTSAHCTVKKKKLFCEKQHKMGEYGWAENSIRDYSCPH